MGSRLVGVLAFVTFIHFGARAAAPATVFEVSDLATPTALPVELDDLVEADAECSLVVVYDPGCPACARAAQFQSEQGELPLDVVWVAEDEAAQAHYVSRVHEEARIVVEPGARDALQIRAVPAAFLVADGSVLFHSTISGSEDLDRVAARCTAPSDT